MFATVFACTTLTTCSPRSAEPSILLILDLKNSASASSLHSWLAPAYSGLDVGLPLFRCSRFDSDVVIRTGPLLFIT